MRRVPEKLSWALFSIGVCELAERFSFYGATQVFTNFIAHPLPVVDGEVSNTGASKNAGHSSGALNQGSQTANALVTFNQFWCYITPLIGAFFADVYWGRYKALCVGVVFAMVGHILLVISAIPDVLTDSSGALGCFAVAIVIMGFGTGFFKSNCSVIIADQRKVQQLTVAKLKTGEKVIIDPALTNERLYLWFYLMINLGSFGGQLGMVYAEKYKGYWLAYLLPTLVFIIPIPVLWFGRNYYVKVPPTGSVLYQAICATSSAVKHNWTWNMKLFWRRARSKEFWDCVKPSNVPENERKKWMCYDDNWIDQLRRGIQVCAIFLLFPFYWICYNQILNNLILQADQMDLGGLPTEFVAVLDPLFIIVFVFILNMGFYPMLDRMKIPFTPIKRIVVGFIIASFAMTWSAVLQHYIYQTNDCGNNVGDHIIKNGIECKDTYSNLSVWVQAGSYIFMALSELFASVTSMEIAVLMAPNNMRSTVMAISLFTTAFAAAINEAFSPLAQNPLFIVNYAVFAGLSFVAGILFWYMFRSIDRNQENLNLMSQDGYLDEVGYKPESNNKTMESEKPVTEEKSLSTEQA